MQAGGTGIISDDYYYKVREFVKSYPGQVCLASSHFQRFTQTCTATEAPPSLGRVQEVLNACETQVFKNQYNLQSVPLAEAYIQLMVKLEDVYPLIYKEAELS